MLEDELTKQQKYVLSIAKIPLKCPVCHCRTSQLEASGLDPETFVKQSKESYNCPSCNIQLTHHVGLFAGHYWFDVHPEGVEKLKKLLDS